MFFLLGALATLVVPTFSQTQPTRAELEARWDSIVADYVAQDAVKAPPRDAYLFVGSSSVTRWRNRLAQDFSGVEVINRGGAGTLGALTRAVDRIIIPYQPKMIVVYCGDNNIVGRNESPKEVAALFKELVAAIRRGLPRTPIAYISMKPALGTWTDYGEKVRLGNQLIEEYIRHDSSLRYIDIFNPMLNEQGKPRPELFSPDKEHLNDDGYALWATLVKKHLS